MTLTSSLRGANGIYAIEAQDLRWIDAARPGLKLAPVTEDRTRGRFMGLLGFEPLASTGLHQHLDIAFSYFLDGGLTDFQGTTKAGEMGINLTGATHDAIAYRKTLTASRLEGPVLYEGPGDAQGTTLHAGARQASIVNEHPEVMPDINIEVASLPVIGTSVAGVSRRTIYDYHLVKRNGRSVQMQFLAGTKTPPLRISAPLSIFVIGGSLKIGDAVATGGGFLMIDDASQFTIGSPFGALALAWAEGPSSWIDRDAPDLFGF